MPYCQQCGFQYPDNARFCGGCGQQVGTKTVASMVQPDLSAGQISEFIKKG